VVVRPDLTVEKDERSGGDPWVVVLGGVDEDQGHPTTPEASTSGVVIDGTGHRDNRTSECSRPTRLRPGFMRIQCASYEDNR